MLAQGRVRTRVSSGIGVDRCLTRISHGPAAASGTAAYVGTVGPDHVPLAETDDSQCPAVETQICGWRGDTKDDGARVEC